MPSAIAILTFRRGEALKDFMDSLRQHCAHYPVAVFEDCGNADGTVPQLVATARLAGHDQELQAMRYEGFDYTAFIGDRNLGVSGNSNRALRWWARDHPECDHLCLCNDDLLSQGDFPALYAEAHQFFSVGLFCFCDFKTEEYLPVKQAWRGRPIHLLPRMTGMMMSLTKGCFDKIGYYDADTFGKFGQEHVEYTHRARLAGELRVNNADQPCLDVPCDRLASQAVASSISPLEKPALDVQAQRALDLAVGRYRHASLYCPFSLGMPPLAGADGSVGIPTRALLASGYEAVPGWVPRFP